MVPKSFLAFVIGFYCLNNAIAYTIKRKACDETVGIQSGDVDDDDITVSSKRKDFNVLDAWCAAKINRKQYFQVNLGEKTKITKVSTQGRLGELDRHVKSYRLYYSLDGEEWNVYKSDGIDKATEGTTKSYGIEKTNSSYNNTVRLKLKRTCGKRLVLPTNERPTKKRKTTTIFKGNKNSFEVMDHKLHPPIVAKYLRINPTSWKNDICLRVEFYGCDA